MFMMRIYPTWDEIRLDLTKEDLLGLLDEAIDNEREIGAVVFDYIEENYDPEYVEDPDAAYNQMKDDKLTEGL